MALSHTPGLWRPVTPPPSFSRPEWGIPRGVLLRMLSGRSHYSQINEEVRRELAEGSPSIMQRLSSPKGIVFAPHTLQPGEERIVADRVAQVLGPSD